MSRAAESSIGRFRVERPLPGGGLLRHVEAEAQKGPPEPVRVTYLPGEKELTADRPREELLALFDREMKAALDLRARHLVPVLEHGVEGDRPFAVSPRMNAITLEALIAEHGAVGGLPVRVALAIAEDLGLALSRLHQADPPTAHLGLHPAAILLDAHGTARLDQIGWSRLLEETCTRVAERQQEVAWYRAPEQVAKGRGEKGPHTDLFAYGALLYQMLTGRRPFDAPTPVAALIKISTGRLVPLSEVAPELPSALRLMVERLLSVDPARRPATMTEVLEVIAAFPDELQPDRALLAKLTGLRPDAEPAGFGDGAATAKISSADALASIDAYLERRDGAAGQPSRKRAETVPWSKPSPTAASSLPTSAPAARPGAALAANAHGGAAPEGFETTKTSSAIALAAIDAHVAARGRRDPSPSTLPHFEDDVTDAGAGVSAAGVDEVTTGALALPESRASQEIVVPSIYSSQEVSLHSIHSIHSSQELPAHSIYGSQEMSVMPWDGGDLEEGFDEGLDGATSEHLLPGAPDEDDLPAGAKTSVLSVVERPELGPPPAGREGPAFHAPAFNAGSVGGAIPPPSRLPRPTELPAPKAKPVEKAKPEEAGNALVVRLAIVLILLAVLVGVGVLLVLALR